MGVAEGIISPCGDGFIDSRVNLDDDVLGESMLNSRGSCSNSPNSINSLILDKGGRPMKRKEW